MGTDIKIALGNGQAKLCNGITLGTKVGEKFNGMGCLAAWLVCQLKSDIGNVYIEAPDSHDMGEEYTYTLSPEGFNIRLRIESRYVKGGIVWEGDLCDFDPKTCEKETA